MARSQQTDPEVKDAKASSAEARAEAKAPTTLVSPDGKKEWDPADAVERVNLVARGWKPKS